MTLLEIESDYRALGELLESSGGELLPEHEEIVDALFKEIEQNEAEKVDGYCEFLNRLASELAVAKAREEQFAMARRSRARAIENLKERLKEYGLRTQKLTCSEDIPSPARKKKKPGNKIETKSGWVVSVQNAGGLQTLTVDESADIPDAFLTYLPPVVNNAAIRKALDEGEVLYFAKLEERGINLIIK